jgi:hypothetical protein
LSRSLLNCHRNDARTVENGLVSRSGVSKSAKVVLDAGIGSARSEELNPARSRHRDGGAHGRGVTPVTAVTRLAGDVCAISVQEPAPANGPDLTRAGP